MKSSGCCPCLADAIPPRARRSIEVARRQAGVALMTVLLIVFLASATAVSLAALQQRAVRRGTVLQHQEQARLYALGAEQLAAIILARDRKQNAIDHPSEAWAQPLPAPPVEGGAVLGRIRDLQGCFNLNNLWQPAPAAPSPSPDPNRNRPARKDAESDANTGAAASNPRPIQPKPPPTNPNDPESTKEGLNQAQMQILQRLLQSLELKPALAQVIADWIDPDSDPLFPDGAEDSDYAVLNPPYLAANRPFVSVSELRLVKGVDQEAYAKLAPYVCALPPGIPLNVNTAPARVLAALGEGLAPVDIERLLENRPGKGYQNVDELLNALKLTVDARTKALLGVGSEYFSLRAEARVGDGRAMLYSVLHRDENGVRVLRRDFGNED